MYERIKQLYDELQDEESKVIFEKRLQYSLTAKKKYLGEMVRYLVGKYRQTDPFHKLLEWLKKRGDSAVVVFGAGFAGFEIVEALRYYGIEADCICDNNADLWGKKIYRKQIVQPKKLLELYRDASIIIASNLYSEEIYGQLIGMGIEDATIFQSACEWWIGNKRQYFDKDIMQIGKEEVFVDGGAYRGEDSRQFIEWCEGNYRKIHIFEPDEKNHAGVLENTGTENDRICLYNKGLWSKRDTLRFRGEHSAASKICEDGESIVEVVSLDETLGGQEATFIKMDIEGCEMEALKGARNTIQNHHPKLAICVYHKPEDIIDIQLYIRELYSGYRFYLRHYSYIFTETVLYAIPE